MTYHFSPSLLGRVFYSFLACCLGLGVFFTFLILIYAGRNFAVGGPEPGEAIVILLLLAVNFLFAFPALHCLRIAASSSPELILDQDGVHYRMIGVGGLVSVKWRDVLGVRHKGFFKAVHLSISLRKRADVSAPRNIFYKTARWLFPALFLSRYEGPGKPWEIHVFRPSIGVSFEKLKAAIEEGIDHYYDDDPPHKEPARVSHYAPAIPGEKRLQRRRAGVSVFSAIAFVAVVALPFSGFALGYAAYSGRLQSDPQVARTQILYEQAAAGDADAQNKLGWRYSRGVGVHKSERRAFMWFTRSAEQGFAKAQYNLGLAYRHGRGTEKDYSKAAQWFWRAANRDLRLAKEALANLYYTGKGVDQSYAKAMALYKDAAGKGNGRAYFYLALMHEKGHGTAKSKEMAIEYYNRALERGFESAKKELQRLGV
ncbi:MAG: tetratricopeptide repeat protein [Pseudomonadota bacterium]